MKPSIGPALKRLLRVMIAGAIAGAVASAQQEMSSWQIFFLLQPAITAAIAALGKYIRNKWGIKLPI